MRLFLYILLVVGTLFAASSPAAGLPAQRSIYVMRHLPPGEGADPGLSPAGTAQAEHLARLLGSRPIKAIFVTDTRRSRQTAAPLAARLRLVPTIYDPFGPERLQESVQAVSGDVLIVGHSNTVPDLVSRFGGEAPEPLGHDDFGTLWRIAAGKSSTMKLVSLEE